MGFWSTSKYPAIVALSNEGAGTSRFEIGSRTPYVQMGISFLVIYILWYDLECICKLVMFAEKYNLIII